MKFLSTLLSLFATASAIDLYMHGTSDCSGGSIVFTNKNPDICFGDWNAASRTIALRAIPRGWNVELRGYSGGFCNTLRTVKGNNGGNWICDGDNGVRFSGVGYNFVGKKRAEPEPEPSVGSECERPDALLLADGTKYDLSSLSSLEAAEFYDL